MANQLTGEWQEGLLWCELRDYENGGIEDTVIFGVFRVDEFADVVQRAGEGSRKLCDMLNAVRFTSSRVGFGRPDGEVSMGEAYHAMAKGLSR
jgi:hypothetical protein